MIEPLRYPNATTQTALNTIKILIKHKRLESLVTPIKHSNSVSFRACSGVLRDEWLRLKNAQKTN